MIDRRTFLAGTGAVLLVAPFAAEAQQAAKVARVGYLATNLAAIPHVHEAFRQGLRDLGYVAGRNVVIEYRNLKTAKALGLTIPQSVLGRADEVIE